MPEAKHSTPRVDPWNARLGFGASIPDQDQIAATIAHPDPVLRNLQITQTYHELTLALAGVLGARDVSWCAYATWASKTAGRFIRGEVLAWPGRLAPRAARRRLPLHPRPHRRDRGVVADLRARVGAAATAGNLLVFAELAPLYAQLVELLRASPAPDPGPLLGALRAGPVEEGGQDLLRRAFAAYFEIAALPDGKRRSERMLLASALVGLHEQTRLQPPIASALAAPTLVLLPWADHLEPHLRALSTRWFMALDLPRLSLRLGEDIPPLGSGGMFPPDLLTIDDPELCALLDDLDRSPDTTLGSAARDWAALSDRMNYIVDLFRSRQQDTSLYRPPFTPEQVAALRAGVVPPGPF